VLHVVRWTSLKKNTSSKLLPFATMEAFGQPSLARTVPQAETSDVIAVFSSTRLPGFSGHDLLTTTGSSATSHHVGHLLSCLLKRAYRSHRPQRVDGRMMPEFPSYCTGSLLMITSSSTCCRCSRIGHRDFSHTHPDRRPNQVCLRYVPSTS
jgi:hypothetical protein